MPPWAVCVVLLAPPVPLAPPDDPTPPKLLLVAELELVVLPKLAASDGPEPEQPRTSVARMPAGNRPIRRAADSAASRTGLTNMLKWRRTEFLPRSLIVSGQLELSFNALPSVGVCTVQVIRPDSMGVRSFAARGCSWLPGDLWPWLTSL